MARYSEECPDQGQHKPCKLSRNGIMVCSICAVVERVEEYTDILGLVPSPHDGTGRHTRLKISGHKA